LDRFTIGDRNPPRTVSVEGADIYSCLLLLTKPYGMDCDYRYGSVWITTASNAIDWHDPTGVSGLAPPPDSALAEVWNKTTPFPAEFVETPLTDALTSLQDMLRVKFDTSRLTADPQRGKIPRTSFNGRDRALKNILGAILYETGCTCRLDGESIVILPPEAP
jgi:hypothetical protein